MTADPGTSLGALGLLIGFPLLLLGGIWVLGWLEDWMLRPYERAVEIERLLAEAEETDELERAVIAIVADVADPPARGAERRSLQGTAG